jgi:hypothetical protein
LAVGRDPGWATRLPFAGFDERLVPRGFAAFAAERELFRAEAGRAGFDARADALAAGFFDAAAEREGRGLLGIVGG